MNCFPPSCFDRSASPEQMPENCSERKNACAGCLGLRPVQLNPYAAKKFKQIFAQQNFLATMSDVILLSLKAEQQVQNEVK